MNYQTLEVTLAEGVVTVTLNRPDKANAMNLAMWQELRTAFRWVDETPQARVAILAGAGRAFCSGIDLALLGGLAPQLQQAGCEGRAGESLRRLILDLQDCLTSIERCRKPVLAAIHGACIGGGVDLVACCDMRYASSEARFAIKEIDMGMTADVGTLQRLPKLVPSGIVRELAYTGRVVEPAEARAIGLVERVWETPAELAAGVRALAASIAAKSPLAVRGTKAMLLHARDHSVAEGLEHVASWNAAMLLSADLGEAMAAAAQRRTPVFRD
ncbi:MAG: crotonase/enoyl-CoA hydratase family protein [Steroidobacteraceae bacterium]